MGKFIRLGNNVIQIDSIISAQYRAVEYPYCSDERYEKDSAAKAMENIGGIFTALGALSSLTGVGKAAYEMRQTEILQLKISAGGGTDVLWLYHDSDFSTSLAKIVETYDRMQKNANPFESSRHTRYEQACYNFYINAPTIYPAGEALSDFLNKLTDN